ncbi:MAG TPA: MMPL family transporter, partial [Solirubrobacteraceae bacterium]|nr:MMPL family transporter [Solirubrobacteraceae bacterium]
MLSSLAARSGRAPRRVTLAVLLGIVALIAGAIAAGAGFEDDFTVPGIESQQAQDLLESRFPAQAGAEATVVLTGDLGGGAADKVVAAIERQPHVAGVEVQTAPDGRTAAAAVRYDQPYEELGTAAADRLETATELLPAGAQAAFAGEVFDGSATGGFPIGEVAGLLVAMILLLVVLRSLRATGN